MLNKYDCQKFKMFKDKNGQIICENDIVLFDNNHFYQCIVYDNRYCLKCLSVDVPLILLDKICIGEGLSSGIVIKGYKII